MNSVHFFEFTQAVGSRQLADPTSAQASTGFSLQAGLHEVLEAGGPLSSLPALAQGWLGCNRRTTGFRLGRSGLVSDTATYLQVT